MSQTIEFRMTADDRPLGRATMTDAGEIEVSNEWVERRMAARRDRFGDAAAFRSFIGYGSAGTYSCLVQ